MIMQAYEANERLRCNTVRKGIQPVTPIWITYGEIKCIQLGTLQHIMEYMTYEDMTISNSICCFKGSDVYPIV